MRWGRRVKPLHRHGDLQTTGRLANLQLELTRQLVRCNHVIEAPGSVGTLGCFGDSRPNGALRDGHAPWKVCARLIPHGDRQLSDLYPSDGSRCPSSHRAVTGAHARTLFIARARTDPRREVLGGGKRRRRGPNLSDDLLGGIDTQARHRREPLHRILVLTEQPAISRSRASICVSMACTSSSAMRISRRYRGWRSVQAPSASANWAGVARRR
jgi:hypothetical protein